MRVKLCQGLAPLCILEVQKITVSTRKTIITIWEDVDISLILPDPHQNLTLKASIAGEKTNSKP